MAYVPDLSIKGWITNPLEKADKLIAHFYAAEQSQSNYFRNDVHSFTSILQRNLGNQTGLVSDLTSELTKYFGKYFTNVQVSVRVTDSPGSSSKQNVDMSISFEDVDGKKYDLSKVIELADSLFEKYTHLNNTGTQLNKDDDYE